jgi:hypothetical protein
LVTPWWHRGGTLRPALDHTAARCAASQDLELLDRLQEELSRQTHLTANAVATAHRYKEALCASDAAYTRLFGQGALLPTDFLAKHEEMATRHATLRAAMGLSHANKARDALGTLPAHTALDRRPASAPRPPTSPRKVAPPKSRPNGMRIELSAADPDGVRMSGDGAVSVVPPPLHAGAGLAQLGREGPCAGTPGAGAPASYPASPRRQRASSGARHRVLTAPPVPRPASGRPAAHFAEPRPNVDVMRPTSGLGTAVPPSDEQQLARADAPSDAPRIPGVLATPFLRGEPIEWSPRLKNPLKGSAVARPHETAESRAVAAHAAVTRSIGISQACTSRLGLNGARASGTVCAWSTDP